MNLKMKHQIPHLEECDRTKQLIVDGKPFLVLGGELQNSSLSSSEHMKAVWPKLASDNINTALGGVSWEQIEPAEGCFDFSELDNIVRDARAHEVRLVLLWFGSWKNGLSTYAPGWVKKNCRRFPRAKLRKARGVPETADILSLFGGDLVNVERKALERLMQHIKEIDEGHSTVIMLQVENEVGILGDSRDASPRAKEQFAAPVPHSLIQTLRSEWKNLHENLRRNISALEDDSTAFEGKSWIEVFGDSAKTDEIFMAYNYAQHVEKVASAGKQIYPLPMFTNVWQNYGAEDRDTSLPIVVGGGSDAGVYPSGGGVIDVLDIWQLYAPSLDFIAPDIYLNRYESSCAKYRHRGQPLFIPEQRRDEYGARRIWEAFGSHAAIGTSPFGIDTVEVEHGHNPFKRHYSLLSKVSHHVLAAQRRPGSMKGFFFDELDPSDSKSEAEQIITTLGEWKLTIERSFVFGRPSPGSGLVIHLDESRFLLVGWGFQVSFQSNDHEASFSGLLSVQEKEVVDAATGDMKTLRLVNGDETRSGKSVVMPSENPDYGGFPISISIPAKTGIAEVEVYSLKENM